jgi:serine/threonine protein kinase
MRSYATSTVCPSDSKSFALFRCPSFHRKYTLGAALGEGGFGSVYSASRLSDNAKVAVKLVRKDRVPKDRLALDQTMDGRQVGIPMEAYILRRLQNPHIVPFLDFFQDNDTYCLVMELHGASSDGVAKSCDLFECIERNGVLSEDVSRYIFSQVLEAVMYMATMNVYHMDLKDENIVIDNQCRVKIIDFGSAHIVPNPSEQLFERFFGTVDYAAPEILSGNAYRVDKSEVWCLGILLYTMVCGSIPFDSMEAATQAVLHPFPSSVSKECQDLITSMLQRDPQGRPSFEKIAQHSFLGRTI